MITINYIKVWSYTITNKYKTLIFSEIALRFENRLPINTDSRFMNRTDQNKFGVSEMWKLMTETTEPKQQTN